MTTALKISEAQLMDAVAEMAQTFGWKVAHFRPAQSSQGWRTAVQYDGAGFPDLVLARRGSVIFAELKGETGRLSAAQIHWLIELAGPDADLPILDYGRAFHPAIPGENAVRVCTWTPDDWRDGAIEAALR